MARSRFCGFHIESKRLKSSCTGSGTGLGSHICCLRSSLKVSRQSFEQNLISLAVTCGLLSLIRFEHWRHLFGMAVLRCRSGLLFTFMVAKPSGKKQEERTLFEVYTCVYSCQTKNRFYPALCHYSPPTRLSRTSPREF